MGRVAGAPENDVIGSPRVAGDSRQALTLDGEPYFLFAGDMHYFRTSVEQWRDSLTKMRSAGCTTVLTYVPWNWHEPTEGAWDWTGTTHPQRDLVGFLSLLNELELTCLLRPGPFITAEWLNGGIPSWLIQRHPEIMALDAANAALPRDIEYPPVSYLHPVYEDYVYRYLSRLLPTIRPFLCANAGPIVGIQLDDEPSYWQLLREGPTRLDYNRSMVGTANSAGFFQTWLADRYASIDQLNRHYRSNYSSFESVEPPRTDPRHFAELPRHLDWYYCKLDAINQHVLRISRYVSTHAAEVPQYFLFPYLLLQAASRFAAFAKRHNLRVLTGCECYIATQNVATFGEDHVGTVAGIHEIYKTWSLDLGTPPLNLETQAACGFHVSPGAMEALTALEIGHGLNGISYYMFAGGDTPPGYVLQYGGSYDSGSPIGAKGEIREHYDVLSRFGEFVSSNADELLQTTTLQDMAFGFYEPYEAVSLMGNSLEYGLRDSYRDVYENYFGVYYHSRRGPTLYTLLALSGINYGAVDLESATLEQLARWPQIWVLGLDFMHREVQAKLVEYVQRGGKLIMLPSVPYLDERFEACAILRTLFPAGPLRASQGTQLGRLTPHHAVRAAGIEDMAVLDYIDTFEPPDDAEVLAFDVTSGRPCAYRRPVGQGWATLIGFKLRYWWDARLDHKRFADLVFRVNGGVRVASAEGWELVVRERASDRCGFLFVVNPQSLRRSARITYRNPRTRRMETIPRVAHGVELIDQGGLVLSLETPAGPFRLQYATSQVQAVEPFGAGVRLKLYGHGGTVGEAALEIGTAPPECVSVDSHAPLTHDFQDGILIVTYRHTDEPTWLTIA